MERRLNFPAKTIRKGTQTTPDIIDAYL